MFPLFPFGPLLPRDPLLPRGPGRPGGPAGHTLSLDLQYFPSWKAISTLISSEVIILVVLSRACLRDRLIEDVLRGSAEYKNKLSIEISGEDHLFIQATTGRLRARRN